MSGYAAAQLDEIEEVSDGENLDAPVGTLVFVRPAVKRTALTAEPETTIIALGGVPGKAYEPVSFLPHAPSSNDGIACASAAE